MKRQSAQGSGLGSNDVTMPINKLAYALTMKTVSLCDKYRDYCKTTKVPMSFLEFKRSLKNKV